MLLQGAYELHQSFANKALHKFVYVALSRARQTAHIYTDDREMLPFAMSREMDKASAFDLVPAVGIER